MINLIISFNYGFLCDSFPSDQLKYVQCVYIVKAKYQIAPSKAVIGVDRPIKALSMHIQKRTREHCLKFSS